MKQKVSHSAMVDNISAATGLSKKTVNQALDHYWYLVQNALGGDQAVTLKGVGTLEPVARPERQGRHPKTGEPIKIASSTGAKLKVSQALLDALNGS